MTGSWLTVGVFAVLLAATAAFSLADLPGKVLSTTTEDCHWLCGKYGVFLECKFDEVVVGSCGSQSWANCENKNYCPGLNNIYAAIQCCKLKVTVEE